MAISGHDQDQPGSTSQPEGDGPVELSDRTEPGGQGSPDTNQAKTEPMSPTPDHPEPAAVPTLASMNVGSADPQAPAHPAAATPTSGSGGTPPQELSGPGGDADAQRGASSTGTAQRAPGSLGDAPEGEAFGVDLEAGAARMTPTGGPGDREGLSSGHGDAGPSPVAGDAALEGSSEEQQVVTGTRLPTTQ